MTDASAYIRAGEVFDPLLGPIVRSAIDALRLPPGSRGLDAGCGIGLQALRLAEVVGPNGHVTGLDIAPEFLHYAERTVKAAALSERISFREGDVTALPFDDDAFDWAWSSCCVGYAASLASLSSLVELARVVKPGGIVAILVWSSECLLPGYPVLEARLRGTIPGIAPYVQGKPPESHYLNALGLVRQAGLREPTARTFVGDAHAPLSDETRAALLSLLEMRWPGAESELTPADRAEYERLCRPSSPDFILDHPDYYAFFTCSMFYSSVA